MNEIDKQTVACQTAELANRRIRTTLEQVSLEHIGLSSEDADNRKHFLGGSDARIIASGNQDAILELWKVKTGQSRGPDFSNRLDVLMGSWTETLNRLWYEKKTGNTVHSAGAQFTSVSHPFMGCSLDGIFVDEILKVAGVFEAKHVNPFHFDINETAKFYMGQLQHNMYASGYDVAHISPFYGSSGWTYMAVAADPVYQARLIRAEEQFWEAVISRTPPGEIMAPPVPLTDREMRTVDMIKESNHGVEWLAAATDFKTNKDAAKVFKDAKETLKGLVPEDAVRAHGAGVEMRRSTSGSLTTYLTKPEKPTTTKRKTT